MCTYLIVELLGIWKTSGIPRYLEVQGIPLEYMGFFLKYLNTQVWHTSVCTTVYMFMVRRHYLYNKYRYSDTTLLVTRGGVRIS